MVNHLSASISIVSVSAANNARVINTLFVGDEPRDIVFAGPNHNLAFITTAHRGQNSPDDPELFAPGVGVRTYGSSTRTIWAPPPVAKGSRS